MDCSYRIIFSHDTSDVLVRVRHVDFIHCLLKHDKVLITLENKPGILYTYHDGGKSLIHKKIDQLFDSCFVPRLQWFFDSTFIQRFGDYRGV